MQYRTEPTITSSFGKRIASSNLSVIHEQADVPEYRYETREPYQASVSTETTSTQRDVIVGRLREKYSNPERFEEVSTIPAERQSPKKVTISSGQPERRRFQV
jgi:hypothetical protein